MGEGDILVSLKNTGSVTCTLQGFPGVDLKSKEGTASAERSTLDARRINVRPGEETRFTLHYPPNHTGGSGLTYTSLTITPPDETRSHTLPTDINVPVSDTPAPIEVDPIGTGK
ncbi:DUF4232 domain-containing protein [Streptomyces sp. HNM0574]|uniref:DUF4232 domain-containing protein n=1 Tax=Streptomyces sp. HNM0574 TaxID=2714954 RepID=UPI0032176968